MSTWLSDAISHRDLAAKTAAFSAAATIGSSFAPNLLPRGPVDQAIATGVSASLAYGVTSMTQSFIDGLSWRLAPGRDRPREESRKYLNAIAGATAVASGVSLQRLFRPARSEPVKRAAVRTVGWELTVAGAASLGITAFLGLAEEIARRRGGTLPSVVVPIGFFAGSVVSAAEISWYRRHQSDAPPLVNSLAQGTLVMAAVSGIGFAETRFARFVADIVRKNVPGLSLLAEPVGHGVGLGLLGAGLGFGMEYAYRQAEQGGSAVEAAYDEPPELAGVSGGPQSLVKWDSLSREGRRFVNMALSPEDINGVTGSPAIHPIRAFVGLSSAPTVDARVALAMQELEHLGAFERSILCLCSPTGTGYLNYVMAESLEYATNGDCAIIGLQYSLRPSFLSLDRVKLGREQNRALLHAINGRLMGIPQDRRPKLVAFGESLGAHTMQDSFIHEGTGGLARAGVERALFIGTPAESKWAEQVRQDPQFHDPNGEVVEVASYSEWLARTDGQRELARFFLLTHHEDPITKFSPALAVQAPPWLSKGPQRSPAIPEGVGWEPFTNFVMTAVDLKNATNVIPGTFEAKGHDYRADLARFTVIAFGLTVSEDQLSLMELALRERELVWAQRRVIAEQFAQARESVSRQVKSWNVPSAN